MNFLILGVLFIGNMYAFDAYSFESKINKIANQKELIKQYQDHIDNMLSLGQKYFDPSQNESVIFDCNTTLSSEPVTSVHRLRPSDVKVVAAMGDSITAALGADAKTVAGLLWEFRGYSWSIGGEASLEKMVTMPNILKKFNPKLVGYARRQDTTKFKSNGTQLSVAISGQA